MRSLVASSLLLASCSVPRPQAPDAAQLTGCGLPLAAHQRTTRVAWLAAGLRASTQAFAARYADGTGGLRCPPADGSVKETVHAFGDYALAELALADGGDVAARALAQSAISCLFSYQQLGPAGGPTHGAFPFHLGDPPSVADNSTEFALLPLAALASRQLLSPMLLTTLAPRLEAALDAIDRHAVCPGYTNICLMQTAEMLALGGALTRVGDANGAARVASGLQRLDGWLAFTRGAGVHEFDSPTYGEVDLEVLLTAFAAGDGDTRAKAGAALEYLWSDYAANFFAGRGSLGGPLSRSYDFITGQGALTISLYLEGLRHELPSQLPDPAKAVLLLNERAADGYHPSSRALCLSTQSSRAVQSTYGTDPGQQRYAFITRDFALGSTSADYFTNDANDQDSLVRGELASSPTTPAFVVIPDYLDAPGSAVQAGDFTKITHLLLSPASVQHEGTLLTLLRVPARDPHYRRPDGTPLPLVNLATNVVMPAAVDELDADGGAVDATKETALPTRVTLTARIGSAALAVSVIEASGLECVQPDGSIVIQGQKAATARFRPLPSSTAHSAAARLALYHVLTLPSDTATLANCYARVALAMSARHCDGPDCTARLAADVQAANAAARRSFDTATGDWDVRVRVANGPELHVRRLVGNGARVVAREINGAPLVFSPLSIDGQPVLLGP